MFFPFQDLRKEYRLKSLNRNALASNPFKQFSIWLEEAQRANIPEYNAMSLATVSSSLSPSCRTVLLKGVDHRSFLFFTNYESRKAQELEQNPRASLLFLWKELERQVSIEGIVEKVSSEESQAYFDQRPRGSQIATWASQQSRLIASRAELEQNYQRIEKQYEGQPIPLPPFWGGYRLLPSRFEFWQGRPNRLHDRFAYLVNDHDWQIEQLAP